ncbi:MAG: MarR family winged helix-turn-helix transcriptional regulator [Spirochaetales bacterium]
MIVELIRELHVTLQNDLMVSLSDLGLAIDEYYALRVLDRSESELRMSDLSSLLLRDNSAATRIVDALEHRALTRRRLSSQDRRARYVEITQEGRLLLARAESVARRVAERRVRVLQKSQQEELERSLRLLLKKEESSQGERDE